MNGNEWHALPRASRIYRHAVSHGHGTWSVRMLVGTHAAPNCVWALGRLGACS